MGAIFSLNQGERSERGKGTRKRGAEPIEMRERRHGYFPQAFIWRGRRYEVCAVERCWTVTRRDRGGRVEQHRFRVRCREGTFEVYQDVRHNTWHVQVQPLKV